MRDTAVETAEAQFALGVEMLGRARSLEDAARAAQLIEAASATGHAPASEQCALIECMGIGRPINRTRALDRLELAKEQGSERAGRQLLLLASSQAEPVRSNISLEALVGPREGLTATQKPLVRVFARFASPNECRWLIETARERLGPSTV